MNNLFEKEYVGYRYIEGFFVPITSETEIMSVRESIDNADDKVRGHLENALPTQAILMNICSRFYSHLFMKQATIYNYQQPIIAAGRSTHSTMVSQQGFWIGAEIR